MATLSFFCFLFPLTAAVHPNTQDIRSYKIQFYININKSFRKKNKGRILDFTPFVLGSACEGGESHLNAFWQHRGDWSFAVTDLLTIFKPLDGCLFMIILIVVL